VADLLLTEEETHLAYGLVSLGALGVKTDRTYPLVNKLVDPENSQFSMETSLPTSIRVYVNLPEGIYELVIQW